MTQSKRKTKNNSQDNKLSSAAKKRARSFIGSIKIVGDLEEGSRKAAELFNQAIIKSAKDLE